MTPNRDLTLIWCRNKLDPTFAAVPSETFGQIRGFHRFLTARLERKQKLEHNRTSTYRISHTSDIIFGPNGRISLKYCDLYRILDILDERFGPGWSDIYGVYCNQVGLTGLGQITTDWSYWSALVTTASNWTSEGKSVKSSTKRECSILLQYNTCSSKNSFCSWNGMLFAPSSSEPSNSHLKVNQPSTVRAEIHVRYNTLSPISGISMSRQIAWVGWMFSGHIHRFH